MLGKLGLRVSYQTTVVTKYVLKLFEVKLLPAVKEKDKGITKKIREQ